MSNGPKILITKRRRMKMARGNGKLNGFIIGMTIGSIAGGLAALLYTPMTGKKLRKKISKTTDNLLEDVNEYIETAGDMIKERRKQAESLIEDAKRLVQSVV
jgi:gas vesicle protein